MRAESHRVKTKTSFLCNLVASMYERLENFLGKAQYFCSD